MNPLPIDGALPEIVEAARADRTFVLVAPPGAGKTTRVPGALLPHVTGEIWVLQPRRVAARAAARQVARERHEPLGESVGYQVRFDRVGGRATRVWFVTEGILLRRLLSDPLLEGVGAVLLDEFHLRGLEGDLALALLAEVRAVRADLIVGVMSATLDPDAAARFLGGAPCVRSEGRSFPVTLRYAAVPDERPVEDRVADGIRSVLADTDGDVLAFLPGVREIRRTAERLPSSVLVVPLYGDLPPDAQDAALQPGDRQRVVLATNVAETSATVPGVRAVVDGGQVRQPALDGATGLDRLDTIAISRASADQRAGRAGRTAPGLAFRTWTERAQLALRPFDEPEIHRLDLSGPLLQILSFGADPTTFGWFDPPQASRLQAGLTVLARLGAMQGRGLSPLGRSLAALPLHPRLGRLLLEGARLGCASDAALAVAVLSDRDPLRTDGRDRPSTSDVLDRVDQIRERPNDPTLRNVRQVAERLERLVRGGPTSHDRETAMGRAVLAAWPDRVARRRAPGSDRARMVGGKGVRLDGSAVRDAELFVAVDVVADGADAKVRLASAVDRAWLPTDVADEVAWDERARAVRGRRVVRYTDLELAEHPTEVDAIAGGALLQSEARGRLPEVQPDDTDYAELLARLHTVHTWSPDRFSAPDPASLLAGLCAGRRSFAELREADWTGAWRRHLGERDWRELERLAPERIEVPTGNRIRLHWEAGRAPVLAVRIQELFGLARGPTVGDGRVPVVLHLLAPNRRPQQITDDLAGFWDRTWPLVRKELRARYPRHSWPDDPRTAPPQARPKRR